MLVNVRFYTNDGYAKYNRNDNRTKEGEHNCLLESFDESDYVIQEALLDIDSIVLITEGTEEDKGFICIYTDTRVFNVKAKYKDIVDFIKPNVYKL